MLIVFISGALSTVKADNSLYGFDDIQERLRTRIEASGIPPRLNVGRELIYASIALPLFYERRGYNLAWSDQGPPSMNADSLIAEIEKAYINGFSPSSYHLNAIKSSIGIIRSTLSQNKLPHAGRLIDLDFLLTDAFLIYGSHLLSGRIDPITIDPEWFTDLRQMDMAEVLETALANKQIISTLEGLLPPQPGYRKLRDALALYRKIDINGGWPTIDDGRKMEMGDTGDRVIALRRRLAITGELGNLNADTIDVFDDDLEAAVKRFQKRHGLDIDGVVGKQTLAALNVPADDRINALILNLERWRWLPQDMGVRYIIINIANFELDVVEGDTTIINMRAIVGRTYRRTPVFSDKITYLVFNPYWNVPNNIAVADIIPDILKDSEYLNKTGFKVMAGWGTNMQMIDPLTIDWNTVDMLKSQYWFRQEPGPLNALGKVKFMFPNQFNVYLHDTPSRGLFAKSSRDFSSGCIRIEKPLELVEYVLLNDPRWPADSIRNALNTRIEQTVRLPEPIPIHILYWTAWVDPDGTINFRKDIYGRDNVLLEALKEEPPKLN